MQLQDFYHKDGTRHTKGSPAEKYRGPGRGPKALKLSKTRPRRQVPPTTPAFPGQSRQETVGATADG